MRAAAFCLSLLATGCFAEPPPAASDADGGTAETESNATTTGQIPTSPTSSDGSSSDGTAGVTTTPPPDTEGATTTSGCDPDNCDCGEPCGEGFICDEGACQAISDCLLSWGTPMPGSNAAVLVTPITAGGKLGPPVRTDMASAMTVSDMAVSPNSIVTCDGSTYAAIAGTRTVVKLDVRADLSVMAESYGINAPDDQELRALSCGGPDRLVAVLELLGDETTTPPSLQVTALATDAGGSLVKTTGADTIAVIDLAPFEVVSTAWSGDLQRGYIAFSRVAQDVLQLELRTFSFGGVNGVQIQYPAQLDGIGQRLGGVALAPGDTHLLATGLRDESVGTGALIPLSGGIPDTNYTTATNHTADAWAGAGPALFLGGDPPRFALSGRGAVVVGVITPADAPNQDLMFEVAGEGAGVVLAQSDNVLVVSNRTAVSTFSRTNLSEIDSDAIDTVARPMVQHAGSVVVPYPQG